MAVEAYGEEGGIATGRSAVYNAQSSHLPQCRRSPRAGKATSVLVSAKRQGVNSPPACFAFLIDFRAAPALLSSPA